MHPFKPEWDGQDMLGKVKDGSGVDIIGLLVNAMRSSKDGKAFVPTMFARPGQTTAVPKLQYIVRVDGWNWMVGSGLYTDDVDALLQKALWSSLALVVVVVFLGVGAIGLIVSRSVLRQIGGEPTEAIAIMQEVAEGNLDAQIPTSHPGSMLDGLAHMVTSLRKLVTEVRSATDSTATASGEIAQGNNDLAHRTEDTASNLQTTASSMEELTSTVKQTSDSAQTANQMATSAAAVAARGGEVVSRVVSTMQDINASSNKISDIIGVIDGIAFQTNILTLNAAVEAARAGEQGRGFAVVASEVRSLAQRSAAAAKEIKALIDASVEKVASGTQLVGNAGATMTEIVDSVQRVTDIIGEIRSATSEQSQGIAQVNIAVNQLDQMTQQNSALVEQSAAAADSLREQAMQLTQVVALFRVNGSHTAPSVPPGPQQPPPPCVPPHPARPWPKPRQRAPQPRHPNRQRPCRPRPAAPSLRRTTTTTGSPFEDLKRDAARVPLHPRSPPPHPPRRPQKKNPASVSWQGFLMAACSAPGAPGPHPLHQSACLRRKAGISRSSMPPDDRASTRAAACVRLVRHTLGTDMLP